MLAVERRRALIAAVDRAGVVSTEALAEKLGVSMETVRRDLAELDDQGRVRRVRGGAARAISSSGEEPSFDRRSSSELESKRAVAAAAVTWMTEGQTIVIDVGTTSLEIARAVPRDFRGTIATSSLLVAAELSDRQNVDVLTCGGRVRSGDLACSNAHAHDFFDMLHPDIAFLASGGVEPAAGLTDFHMDEVAVRRIIVRNSRRRVVVASASKIGIIAPYAVCDLGDVDVLLTDRRLTTDEAADYARTGVDIRIV